MPVVIPTRFTRPTLAPLIEAARRVTAVVVVHTEPGHADVEGVRNVHDYARNIHSWWNAGLDACESRPTLVLNDDIEATPEALTKCLEALDIADLVYVPGRKPNAATPISGWCFGLHPDRLRPDPAFTWWFGDDDMFRRAESFGFAKLSVTADITHVDRGGFGVPDEFREAIKADKALYRERWGA